MSRSRWSQTYSVLIVIVSVGLPVPVFGEISLAWPRTGALECPQPQVIEVEDPLEIPLVGMVLWGRLEDSAPYLEVARENCLAVVLTETPSGRWFWIPSWDSWEEQQATLDLFRDAGLEIPWSLSGPHSISVFPGHVSSVWFPSWNGSSP